MATVLIPMDITMMTQDQITGPVTREMRVKLGMTQKDFWAPAGVQQSVACRYETGDVAIPKSVRILLVAHYIAGLNIDASTKAGIAELAKLGAIQSSFKTASSEARRALRDLHSASKSIEQAQASLGKI